VQTVVSLLKKTLDRPALVFCALLCLMITGLGLRPFSTPDEGRYVEIPREMVASGEWVVPHLNGLPYFEKPPLVYWIQACALKCFGASPFAMRLPLVWVAFLGCLLVYAFVRAHQGQRAALLSAMILGLSPLYFYLSRFLILDLFLSVFMMAALLSFFMTTRTPRPIYFILYGVFLGLAVLTKGLVGLILPGSVILAWVILERRWAMFYLAFYPLALLSFMIVAVPWHLWVHMRNPHFGWFYFVHEHFLRYTTSVHSRFQPWWFFIPVIILGFFPWIAWGRAIVARHKGVSFNSDLSRFLWVWIVVMGGFFSLSQSKLIPYILPIFPPLAMLTGAYLAVQLEKPEQVRELGAPWIYGVLCCTLGGGIWVARYFGIIQVTGGLDANQRLTILLGVLGAAFLIQGIWVLWRRPKRGALLAGVFGFQVVFLGFLIVIDPLVQRYRSCEELAHLMNAQNPKATVVVFGFYPQDLPVYMGRTVKVLAYEGELVFGHEISPGNDVMMTPDRFRERVKQKGVFVVMLARDLDLFRERFSDMMGTLGVFYDHAPYVVFKG
jgi:4-amino-4-deoxy-L-arabinose transferase-like glycosyltransferase